MVLLLLRFYDYLVFLCSILLAHVVQLICTIVPCFPPRDVTRRFDTRSPLNDVTDFAWLYIFLSSIYSWLTPFFILLLIFGVQWILVSPWLTSYLEWGSSLLAHVVQLIRTLVPRFPPRDVTRRFDTRSPLNGVTDFAWLIILFSSIYSWLMLFYPYFVIRLSVNLGFTLVAYSP